MTAIEVNNNYSMTLAEIKELNKEISKFENNMENLGKEDTLLEELQGGAKRQLKICLITLHSLVLILGSEN